MLLEAEVDVQQNLGDEAGITLTNVMRIKGERYGPDIQVKIPLGLVKNYPIGRIVKIEIKPK